MLSLIRTVRLTVLIISLGAGTVSCTSLKPIPGKDQESIARTLKLGDRFVILLENGEKHRLRLVDYNAESITGRYYLRGRPVEVTLPLAEVNVIEIRKFSPLKTAALVVGVGGMASFAAGPALVGFGP